MGRTGAKAVAVGKGRVAANQRRVQAPGVLHLRLVRAAANLRAGMAPVVALRPCCIVPVAGGANEFHHF